MQIWAIFLIFEKIMDSREILEKVRAGEMSVAEAEAYFRRKPFEDLGFAKLDAHRRQRSGKED